MSLKAGLGINHDYGDVLEHFLPDPNLPTREQLSLSLLDTT
jgi:hypothetical protein